MPRGETSWEVIAEMVGAGRSAAARPAFVPGGDIPMSARARGEAEVGDLVRVHVRGRQARVVEVYGPSRAPGAVMAALLADEGRGHGFPRRVEDAVAAIDDADPLAGAGRRDMRGQDVVTIDPEGAKDHDDAIAARVEGDDVRLWVHIADVAHYVPAGGEIDREAARRGTSVYVPGTVEPMLPSRLSADLCSLRPGVDRRALTAEMVVAPSGEVTSARFHRSVIRSERRLTYPEVDRHLAGEPLGPAGLEATVAAAQEASRRLRARRERRGALEVDSGEPVWELGPDRVEGVHREHQTPSHRLVEDCMIAANEAVARHLIARNAPTLFRFHDDPAAARVDRLYAQLAALDVATPPLPEGPLGPAERREAARAAGEAVGRHLAAVRARGGEVRGEALWALVLRSLAQAYYTPAGVGHSGLASAAYVHFTSPIRRYPDLLAHRALLDTLGLGPAGPGADELAGAGVTSSETEREAAAIERRADRVCAALLLGERLRAGAWDEVVHAEVTGLVPAGAFLAWEEVFEGFLPARRISDEELLLDPLEVALTGTGTGRGVRMGDVLAVRVTDVEPLRGRVTLELAEGGARARRRVTTARRRDPRSVSPSAARRPG